jgi:hypothetical protein
MIDKPSAAGIAVHTYRKGASKFASRFARLLCDVVRQSNARSAKLGYPSTAEKFCRDSFGEYTLNRALFGGCTDFSAHRSPPIFSGMFRQSSRDVDPASGDPYHRGTSGRFGAVVAVDLLHAQTGVWLHLTDSMS